MTATTSPSRTALVLGATGGIGGEIARGLVRDGWCVRAMTRGVEAVRVARRGPERIEWVEGDATVRSEVMHATVGAIANEDGLGPGTAGVSRWAGHR